MAFFYEGHLDCIWYKEFIMKKITTLFKKDPQDEEAISGASPDQKLGNIVFQRLYWYLSQERPNIEGIVFHHPDGMMCKLRKTDFGLTRSTQVV